MFTVPLLLVLTAGGVSAREVIQMEPMVVTANRIEQDLRDIPMSVAVVTREDIRRNPQTSVAGLLQGIAGLSLEDDNMAGARRVSIRGEGSSRVLILIDGVRVSEQKSMNGAAILLDPSNIERIEVIKGPASVLYGSEAIGGVVNIITRQGGPEGVGASMQMVYDSSNQSLEPSLALFGSQQGFNYRFTGSGLNAQDRRIPHDTLENSAFDQRSYSARLGYDWAKGNKYLKADRYDVDMDLPDTRQFPTTIEMDLPTWKRTTYSAGLHLRELGDNLVKLNINAYHQNMGKDFCNHIIAQPDISAPATHIELMTDNDQDSYGGSIKSEWLLFGDHYLVAGFDFNRDDLSATSDDRRWKVLNGFTLPGGSHNFYNYEGTVSSASIFVQDEWSFSEKWKLQLGLRQTWITSRLDSSDDPLAITRDVSDHNLVGNAGLVFMPTDALSLRALVAQGYPAFPALTSFISAPRTATAPLPMAIQTWNPRSP